jgi:uncharacterized coiled-coil protein SlyX
MRSSALALFSFVAWAGCSVAPPSTSPRPSIPTADAIVASGASTVDSTPATAEGGEAAAKAKLGRQIIYRATLLLYVQDFGKADKDVAALIKDAGGYVAQFREDRPSGSIRGGKWTARVPVDKFEPFLDAVSRLGVADHREVHSDDMTEEYVDITARLKNKQQLESRLLEFVAKRADEIRDVLTLETELSRVREEIERMQGRLRYLSDRVALTTIEITAYERGDYRPPEATFAGRIAQTFFLSLNCLRECAEAALLLFIAVLPWALTLALLVLPLVLAIRRRPPRACKQVISASPT